LQKVQRGPFTNQERPRQTDDVADLFTGGRTLAVGSVEMCVNARLDLAKCGGRDLEAGEHTVGLDEERPARTLIQPHRGIGRDVAGAEVLFDRAAYDRAVVVSTELPAPSLRHSAPGRDIPSGTVRGR
jgi:hypothetical protein